MRRYSNLLLITVLFSMTACSLPKTESSNSEEDSATFLISNDGASFTSEQIDKQSSVPVAKTYSFQACLLDRKYSRPVQNHSFIIESVASKAKIAETTSDSNGCIHWNETIKYDHLASAHYVEQKRVISAQGVQKGQRTAHLLLILGKAQLIHCVIAKFQIWLAKKKRLRLFQEKWLLTNLVLLTV